MSITITINNNNKGGSITITRVLWVPVGAARREESRSTRSSEWEVEADALPWWRLCRPRDPRFFQSVSTSLRAPCINMRCATPPMPCMLRWRNAASASVVQFFVNVWAGGHTVAEGTSRGFQLAWLRAADSSTTAAPPTFLLNRVNGLLLRWVEFLRERVRGWPIWSTFFPRHARCFRLRRFACCYAFCLCPLGAVLQCRG